MKELSDERIAYLVSNIEDLKNEGTYLDADLTQAYFGPDFERITFAEVYALCLELQDFRVQKMIGK